MSGYSPSSFSARIGPPVATGLEHDRVDHIEAVRLGSQHVEIRTSSPDIVAAEDGVTVVLHGDEYSTGGGPEAVLRAYLAEGEALFRSLNGSFALVVVDKREDAVLAVTDRFTSRKVFHSEVNGAHWLSSSLALHPSDDHRLDPAGIGSLLACGVAHSDLTPFEGIRKLRPASVYRFSHETASNKAYWKWPATVDPVPATPNLRRSLLGEMRAAVTRRVGEKGTVFVSLSGGYDSRAVAAMLAESIDRERIHSFTYNHGAPVGDTDAQPAAAVAEMLGFGHELVEGYQGDLMAALAVNSASGQGLANFCLEVDAWQEFGPTMATSEDSVLFVADLPGMAVAPKGATPESVLASVDVYPVSTIESFLAQMDPQASGALRTGWGDTYSRLRAEAAVYEDSRVGHDHLYIDQRLSNTLMLWRECFLMPFTRVANPFLDNEVVDLMLSLPVELREMKVLYRQALREAFPNLFAIPTTEGGWNAPDWAREIRDHAGPIRESLDVPSRLDELIPADVISSWLDLGLAPQSTRSDDMTALLKRAVRASTPLRRLVRAVRPKVQPAVRRKRPWDRLMLDLLSLRGFLSNDL